MNVSRRLPDGTRDDNETLNKSQVYVTTAGWKNSFSYEKLIQLLVWQILKPKESMIIGGTWRVPVLEGLLSKSFVAELKSDGTFNDSSFGREYESKWSGDAENAFFSSESFDKCRELQQPEKEYSGRSSKSAYYVLGVDVGRKGCNSEVCIFKVTPQPNASSLKSLVNIYSFNDMHFELQAIEIKRLFYQYRAQRVAIDGNGAGVGLLDFLVISQIDPISGETLPPFGIDNDDEGFYKKFITQDTERDAVYIIKANAPINTEMYTYMQSQFSSNRVKLLIDQRQAKMKLLGTKVGQGMSIDQRNDYLRPFVMTDILREQLLNLAEEREGININLKQVSRGIPKDKVSAFGYGLYYIKKEEERKKRRRKFDIKDFMFMN